MTSVLVVPAEMVPYLRQGLHFKIGDAADDISAVVVRTESQRGAGWYPALLARFDRLRVLLDEIGWEDSDPPVEVRIDLRQHRQAVLEALRLQSLISSDGLQEAMRADAEQAAAGDLPQYETATQRVRAMREWIASVEAQARTLEPN